MFFPYIYIFFNALNPYLTVFMPVIIIWYYADNDFFSREVYVWTHDLRWDTTDRWVGVMYEYNDKF